LILPYRRGVGAVLFNREGLVFVGRRIDIAGEAWQFPQGGIDEGEAPEDAVIREITEEIGTGAAEIIGESRQWLRYDMPDDMAGWVWDGRYRGQEMKWFALRFTGQDRDIVLDASPHPEFSAWMWTDLVRLPELIVPFKRPLYEDIVAEFGALVSQVADTN